MLEITLFHYIHPVGNNRPARVPTYYRENEEMKNNRSGVAAKLNHLLSITIASLRVIDRKKLNLYAACAIIESDDEN